MNRVVITGLGCLTPIGNSPDAVWKSIEAGFIGLSPWLPTEPDPTLKFKNIGQVSELSLDGFTATQIATSERCSQFALVTARQALAQSNLLAHYAPDRIGIVFGCSTNGRSAEEPETAKLYTLNTRVHPLTVPRAMASNGASQVSIDHHITGPAITISTACASGAHAIGIAFHMVRSGMLSAAVCGAHEAALTRGFLRAWDSMRVVSPTMCRPFSGDRDGMSLAEGAAMLTIETLASARGRGAHIYAEILGFGMSTDAFHMTQPKLAGPAQAMRTCLEDAAATLRGTDRPGSLQALIEEVGYISAHGTATQANDSIECQAVHDVFGDRAAHIPISSTKGAHGHSLGASSAIETLITALAIDHRRLPHTVGTTTKDPSLDLDVILGEPRNVQGDMPITAITNSLAFGGLNAILCLRTCV
jgi:3-oxoacyl-[acyl-carrier-protein] synthase II/nodulation protein E